MGAGFPAGDLALWFSVMDEAQGAVGPQSETPRNGVVVELAGLLTSQGAKFPGQSKKSR
jgi:hypothetical protein